MLLKISKCLRFLHYYGLIGIVAYFYPVYFTQDSHFQNYGVDILSYRPSDKFYLHGTWSENDAYFKQINER